MADLLVFLAGIIVAAAVAYWGGQRDGKRKAERKWAEGEAKTKERMDEVGIDDDPHIAFDWLRERGKRGGDL